MVTFFHTGPRRGIPNVLMHQNDQTVKVDPSLVPTVEDALQMFESNGGHITRFSEFGRDPLAHYPQLIQQRESSFLQFYPDFGPLFHTGVNGNTSLFKAALLCFIHVSKQLESQLLS